jgi:hypothetical protein
MTADISPRLDAVGGEAAAPVVKFPCPRTRPAAGKSTIDCECPLPVERSSRVKRSGRNRRFMVVISV